MNDQRYNVIRSKAALRIKQIMTSIKRYELVGSMIGLEIKVVRSVEIFPGKSILYERSEIGLNQDDPDEYIIMKFKNLHIRDAYNKTLTISYDPDINKMNPPRYEDPNEMLYKETGMPSAPKMEHLND
jgi:hypothetical protein